MHALVRDAIDLSVRFAGDTDIEGLCGLLVYMVIRRRPGDAAAFASTGVAGAEWQLHRCWRKTMHGLDLGMGSESIGITASQRGRRCRIGIDTNIEAFR